MLDGLKRLFSTTPATKPDWEGVAPWAEAKQYKFHQVREGDGFIVEGQAGTQAWRLEWGPPQRSYVPGQELRLRAELGLPSELQVVLMNRPLQEQMERAVFEQYVEGVQTRIDNETPPEMRWLVMFPKLGAQEMGALNERYVALSSIKPWLVHWLEGPLSATLVAHALAPEVPFVLMISRGRLTLRTALAEPDPRALEPWLRLFETAVREAHRVAGGPVDPGAPSTHSSLWGPPTDLPPEDSRS